MTAPAHRKDDGQADRPKRLGSAGIATIAGAAVAAAAVTVGAFALTDGGASAARSATGTKTPVSAAPPSTTTTTLPPVQALAVRGITPAPGATHVATDSAITIRFTVAPAATPKPTLSPAVAGHWTLQGDSWVFLPAAGYIPQTTETVTVPKSTTATEEGRTVRLTAAYRSTFAVRPGSTPRLQQLLAELHYLPFTFTRSVAATSAPAATSKLVNGLNEEPTTADAVALTALPGRLTWAYPHLPASLAAQWAPGQANELTKGAVMAFEADHALAVDGVAGPEVWTTLTKAVAARQVDPRPYDYVMVTENQPEVLTVWQAGHDVYSSPANTGVPGATTQQGTFPVYLRYAVHGMIGTDPNGQKYNDPAIPWIAYFNGGDAIHGYPRASYGYPQSNGCVELPIPNAGRMFNSGQDWYGTLVTVS